MPSRNAADCRITDTPPRLFTFRRCPYAIRARLAVCNAGVPVRFQEVALKHKPAALLALSPKGTVPVLQLKDRVIDESLDIMLWALENNDPDGWYSPCTACERQAMLALIDQNDTVFKNWLDKYKYADRHPAQTASWYRDQCGTFLLTLDNLLLNRPWLFAARPTLADMAIFPFIRQFAMVDTRWFEQAPYPNVRTWLHTLLDSPLFARVMQKPVEAMSNPIP